MKAPDQTEVKPSAFNALLSIAIVANNPATQQAFALLALGYAAGVQL